MEFLIAGILYENCMRFYLLMFFGSIFFSCNKDSRKVLILKTNSFSIVDTTYAATQYLNESEYGGYPIFYLGRKQDTFKIGRQCDRGRTKWKEDRNIQCCRNYSNKTLKIFVYTSAQTNSPVEWLSENSEVIRDSTKNYHAFIFSILNMSDSPVYMGRTFEIFFMHKEARDRKGNWVKIEKKLSELGVCGTGQPNIILQPNEIIISKVRRYTGSFVTDFRLVFGYNDNVVYSNTFSDFIDEKMIYKIPEKEY
ncbi:hypothetical protein ACI6Q2_21040 [Chitinophagaceae bacterium LWZ2-11]